MKNVFKYTAIAAAFAAAGTATAGEITTSRDVISSEFVGAQTSTNAVGSIALWYELGASYAVGDLITINHSDFAVKGLTSFPQSVTSEDGKVTVGLISQDATSKTYRVTAVADSADTTGSVLRFNEATGASLNTTYAKLSSVGDISFSFNSTLADGSTVIDNSGTRSGTAVYVRSQIGDSEAGSKFDGTIDVGTERTLFDNGANWDYASVLFDLRTTGDCGVYYTTSSGANACLPFTRALPLSEFTPNASINASLDIDEEGKGVGIQVDNAADVAYADGKIDVEFDPATTNAGIWLINPTGAAATVLRPQEFTYDATVTYGNSGAKEVASNEALGSWVLNGAEVVVPYMPYGPGITQIIYVSNRSDQDGDIYVTAIDEDGNSYELGMVGTATAGSVTKITDDVYTGLGLDQARVSMTITVNAPSNDVEVFAAYNARGNRLSVQPSKKN